MNYNTSTRGGEQTTDLSVVACRTFVGLSVVVSVLGFWSKGWLPCLLLTAFLGAAVFLASLSLGRLVAAAKVRDWRLVAQTSFLGLGFMALEGFLNHLGLDWLNRTYELGPEALAIWGSLLLPAVNVFAVDTYTREIPHPKPRLVSVSPAEKPKLEDVVDRMKKAGVL